MFHVGAVEAVLLLACVMGAAVTLVAYGKGVCSKRECLLGVLISLFIPVAAVAVVAVLARRLHRARRLPAA